jgi:hypothetical protein
MLKDRQFNSVQAALERYLILKFTAKEQMEEDEIVSPKVSQDLVAVKAILEKAIFVLKSQVESRVLYSLFDFMLFVMFTVFNFIGCLIYSYLVSNGVDLDTLRSMWLDIEKKKKRNRDEYDEHIHVELVLKGEGTLQFILRSLVCRC